MSRYYIICNDTHLQLCNSRILVSFIDKTLFFFFFLFLLTWSYDDCKKTSHVSIMSESISLCLYEIWVIWVWQSNLIGNNTSLVIFGKLVNFPKYYTSSRRNLMCLGEDSCIFLPCVVVFVLVLVCKPFMQWVLSLLQK